MCAIKEDEIIFDTFFNIPLSEEIIKEFTKIKKITFGKFFNQPVYSLPDNVTHINFGEFFNQSMDVSNLPKNLIHLNFLGHFSSFNQNVDNLPPNITHLEFGYYFNQSVDFLPSSIKELIFSRDFNQPVDNLPNNITHLTFGRNFNQSINNLPTSLTHIIFEEQYTENTTISTFNQSIEGLSRLTNLKYLKFGYHFSQNICCPIDGHCYLPDSVEELCFENESKFKITSFPKSLKKLYFQNKECKNY